HKAGGRFNFAKPVGISSLQDPDVVVLTCSSYAESSLGAQTTADLDVESMFRALESTSAAFPNGSSTDQFLSAFAKAYSEEVRRTRRVAVGKIGGGVVVAGVPPAVVMSVARGAACSDKDVSCGSKP